MSRRAGRDFILLRTLDINRSCVFKAMNKMVDGRLPRCIRAVNGGVATFLIHYYSSLVRIAA